MISFGAWNVRGLNKAKTQLEVAHFLSQHNISLIGLLETKMKRKGLGSLYLHIFPSWCFTSNLSWHDGGRIIVAWRSTDVHVAVLVCHSQFIHVEVTPAFGAKFMCTFVYGATLRKDRQQLFDELQGLGSSMKSPWIILGDFNCVANLDECIGSSVRFAEVQPLRDCMALCNVHDLNYHGRFFTWNNKQAGANRVMSKIDRVLGNEYWEDSFPMAMVNFLAEGEFDHTPMIVSFSEIPLAKKSFRFFNSWALKDGFIESVRETWSIEIDGCVSYKISQKLRLLKSKLKQLYGKEHLQFEVDKAYADLLFVQNDLHERVGDPSLASQEQAAATHYHLLRKELEAGLRQKAKMNWVKFGDDNTAFFHQSVKCRSRHNRVAYIRFKGRDITVPLEIHKAFFEFYSDLFCVEDRGKTTIKVDTVYQGPVLSP